jgi:NADH-quinone oxidoreductase subunit G
VLVIGSNLRREAPVLAHRLRKAARRGTRVAFVNPARFEYLFPVAHYLEAPAAEMTGVLASLVHAASEHAKRDVPQSVRGLCERAQPDDAVRAAAAMLCTGKRSALLLGALALRHPAYADLRALATVLAQVTDSTLGVVSEGANAAGAWLAGAVPHRGPAGRALDAPGRDAAQMLAEPGKAYLLLNLEAEADCADAARAVSTLERAGRVVMLTPFASDAARRYAHLMLPIGTFAETSGSYVNAEGRWQSFAGAATPFGSARPAWKILRVLGNLLGLAGFEQASSEDVREELRALVGDAAAVPAQPGSRVVDTTARGGAVVDLPMYAIDALVRRAPALQATHDGRAAAARY